MSSARHTNIQGNKPPGDPLPRDNDSQHPGAGFPPPAPSERVPDKPDPPPPPNT